MTTRKKTVKHKKLSAVEPWKTAYRNWLYNPHNAPGFESAFKHAFLAGWDAKPEARKVCVWKRRGEYYHTKCGVVRSIKENFCPFCGGKIKEA